jgi:hypothetical protein
VSNEVTDFGLLSHMAKGSREALAVERNKGGRRITRWVDEHLLEAMRARVQVEPEKVGLRKLLAEHPFGTIKHAMNQGYFLMRGFEKVRAEMSLTVMAYNLKRAIKILGVPRMIEALA